MSAWPAVAAQRRARGPPLYLLPPDPTPAAPAAPHLGGEAVRVGRAGREQDVAAGQVAVHEPAAVQELHARRDLGRRRQQHGPVGPPAAGPEQAPDHRLLRAPRGGRASAQRAAKLGGVALFGCVSESLDVTLPTASCARLCGGRGSARRRVNLGSMARLNRPSASLEKALPPTQSARGARALERQLQCMQRRCWGRPARRTPQTSSTDSLLTLLS